MDKFTPGPWEAGEPAWFRGRSDPTAGKRPITASNKGVIANVYGEGNARLIEAAPEMYAALKEAEAVIAYDLPNACSDPTCDHCERARDSLAQIRAVIAKVEGSGK